MGGTDTFVHLVLDMISSGGTFPFERYPDIKTSDMETLLEGFKFFFKQIINLSISKEGIVSDLTKLNIAEEDQAIIITAIIARWEEIRHQLAKQSVTLNKSYLVDFDWKVHLSMASSSLSIYREPLLLLTLFILNDDKTQKQIIMELTKDDLDTIIRNLEELNSESTKLKFF